MKDSVIFGSGNSRYLKSVADFKTLYPTYDDFAAALVAGTLPVDFNGINAAGFQQIGDALGASTLLKSDTAQKHGRDDTALPDDMWADLVPVGAVFWYAKDDIPDGYLKCDGSTISRTDYARLFAVIGTAFGKGDGSTTFSIPRLLAAFIRGSGAGYGYSATFGELQLATNIRVLQGGAISALEGISVYGHDIQATIKTETFGCGADSSKATVYDYAVRPINVALTPIIKY